MFGEAAETIDRVAVRTPFESSVSVESGRQVKLGKHAAVFRAGDEADRFFEVLSGVAMIYRILDDGRRQVVEIAFPGAICGLTTGVEHESSCETLMPSVLRSFRKSDWARSEVLRARVVRQLQTQLSSMHDHAVSLGRKTAEERICTLLLRLRELERSGLSTAGPVSLPMSRTEMADYLGLTLETVCRTIADLARRKLVEFGTSKNEIGVPSVERLRRAASWDAQAA